MFGKILWHSKLDEVEFITLQLLRRFPRPDEGGDG